jgi:hypothetical protein
MANDLKPWLLLALLAAPLAARADTVACHVLYGGGEFAVDATPQADAYDVPRTPIGKYFAFRVTYVALPQRAAAINIYTYSMVSGTPVLIHQAKHRPPFIAGGSRYGFTGLQSVYEASKASELEYWCERRP